MSKLVKEDLYELLTIFKELKEQGVTLSKREIKQTARHLEEDVREAEPKARPNLVNQILNFLGKTPILGGLLNMAKPLLSAIL
jgi:hypothetical protein